MQFLANFDLYFKVFGLEINTTLFQTARSCNSFSLLTIWIRKIDYILFKTIETIKTPWSQPTESSKIATANRQQPRRKVSSGPVSRQWTFPEHTWPSRWRPWKTLWTGICGRQTLEPVAWARRGMIVAGRSWWPFGWNRWKEDGFAWYHLCRLGFVC